MLVYDDIKNYPKYKQIFGKFKQVKVFKTKYSIKIDFGKKKVFLSRDNDSGNTNILELINRVKNDAAKYIKAKEFKGSKDNIIFWSWFNDTSGVLGDDLQNVDLCKIDLTAAYWTKAINIGLISKSTIEHFEGIQFNSVKEKKAARLKALGSLATVKNVEIYRNGKRDSDFHELIYNQDTKDLYMWVCNEVAMDMQTVLSKVDGVYYYWDCIFVSPNSMQDVKDLFKYMGYRCTVENHKGKVHIGKNISYLCCPNKDGKLIQYPIEN